MSAVHIGVTHDDDALIAKVLKVEFLARLHAERSPSPADPGADPDLEAAHDAAARAARFLERLESGEPGDLDHLL